jgi:GT2 family glycosyltransferase
MSVSIIIPTLYPPSQLPKLIAKVSSCTDVDDIHVVHNHHPKENFPPNPKTTHHYLNTNMGFTGACNYGAHKAKGEHLLFLNDDCILETSTISLLENFLKTHPNLSATQPIVMTSHCQIEHVGFEVDIVCGKAHPIIDPNIWSQPIHPRHIRGLSGTCLLIQKEVFFSVGMFDEAFHSYLEDVDLALTFFEKSLTSLPCLDATIVHQHMQTSSQMGTYKQKRDLLNWWRIILKHPRLFIHYNTFHLLIFERLRNLSGFIKQYLKI